MSQEAMEWVWEQSRARGVARLVLLAIAYRMPDGGGTVYAGTTMLVRRTGASRSSVVRAVDSLVSAGELAVVDGRCGPRGETCYRIPDLATGGVVGGPTTPPVAGSDPRPSDPRGSAMGPEGSHGDTGRGSTTTPPRQIADEEEGEINSSPARTTPTSGAAAARIPAEAQPLIDALQRERIAVTWALAPSEWALVLAAINRWGVEAVARVAVEKTAGREIRSARYLLAIWRDAANFGPAPNSWGTVVPLRRAPAPSYTDNLAVGLALLEGRETNHR
ncbi:hypothetical protein [Streptomyces fractus]|uniref:hypothetical protein n=1 Tax=Streptomyces fractus TaxID=641806 RepID=UPI003CF64706